jgi:hypothetical protein
LTPRYTDGLTVVRNMNLILTNLANCSHVLVLRQ